MRAFFQHFFDLWVGRLKPKTWLSGYSRTAPFALLVGGLALLTLGGCGQPAPPAGGYTAGDKIPDFTLMDSRGQTLHPLQTNPDWFLVIFLYKGIYCDACKQNLFAFKEGYPKFIADRTALVAVSADKFTDSADFDQTWHFPFPLLSDTDFKVIDSFAARHVGGHGIYDVAYPSILIIDAQKVLRYKHVAQNPDELPNVNEILQYVDRFRAGH